MSPDDYGYLVRLACCVGWLPFSYGFVCTRSLQYVLLLKYVCRYFITGRFLVALCVDSAVVHKFK